MTKPEQANRRRVALSVGTFLVTCASTTYVGGLAYSIPLMSILLAHELGHYVAARIHRVPASPPYFMPLPFGPLGTLGAVILMSQRIPRRNALLDIGAAGPLAGLVVTLPILIYGIIESPVQPMQEAGVFLQEGHSLLYGGLLYLLKGPFADGHDIRLSPTAFAGWAGLLVTMINLIPVAQLDGGHVAYALLGSRQERISRRLRALLLPIGLGVGLYYGLPAYLDGKRGEALAANIAAGAPWMIWWLALRALVSRSGVEHPETDAGPLSPGRKLVAIGTLVIFLLLVMPSWLRTVIR